MAEKPVSEKPTSSLHTRGTTTVEECQAMIQKSLRTPMVRFLRQHLEKAGCAVEDNFFKAVTCNQQRVGAYVRGEGVIVCSNYIQIQDEVNQVVIHELIHAFDDCRAANLDWTNCAHHACSEIRAGHLSGDCHYKRELLRGFMKLRGHEQVPTPSNHRYCCYAMEISTITYLFRNVSEEELCNHCLQMPIALVQLPRILWKLYGMFVIMIHSPLTKLLENCMVVGTSI